MLSSTVFVALALGSDVTAEKIEFMPEMLVQARVVNVQEKDHVQLSTFAIEHVYAGHPDLRGKKFTVRASISSPGITNVGPWQPLSLPIQEGETGIWALKKVPGTGALEGDLGLGHASAYDLLTGWQGATPVPARKVLDANPIASYRDGVKWARIVEQVYKSNQKGRVALLMKQARNESAFIQAWSVRMLGIYEPDALAKFLKDLLGEEDLTIAGQVAVDEVLCQIEAKNWLKSNQRISLFNRWTSGDITDGMDVRRVIARFGSGIRGKELEWDTFVALMTNWFATQEISWYSSGVFSGQHPFFRDISKKRKALFEHGLSLVRESGDPKRKLAGARWLFQLTPLSSEEQAVVHELREKIKEREVADYLGQVLRYSKRRN